MTEDQRNEQGFPVYIHLAIGVLVAGLISLGGERFGFEEPAPSTGPALGLLFIGICVAYYSARRRIKQAERFETRRNAE